MIKVNPILGYGMGVSYRVFDIIRDVTFVKSFVHNGYVALWFKFGLWGLGMMLFFLGSLIRRGYRSFRAEQAQMIYRLVGLAALACFAALFVSALTSNPFFRNDTTFIYGTLSGIVGGCYSRTRP
jgi:O-antigen ligase